MKNSGEKSRGGMRGIYPVCIGLLALAVVCSAAFSCWMYERVRSFEKAYGVKILAVARKETCKTVGEIKKKDEPSNKKFTTYVVQEGDDITGIAIAFGVPSARIRELNDLDYGVDLKPGMVVKLPSELDDDVYPNSGFKYTPTTVRDASVAVKTRTNAVEKAEMKVSSVNYDGDTRLEVTLTERPNMDGIRQYVEVGPMDEGVAGISYKADYNYGKRVYEPKLIITGDFANGTNVTLRLRKGLSLYGKSSLAEGSLAEDYTYTFHRRDLKPSVAFAHAGRYLPPSGGRTLAIESVNEPSVRAKICRVEPANIVQLLAREEMKYANYYYYDSGVDSKDTAELAGFVTESLHQCQNALNRKEIWQMPVGAADGGPSNGVYLVGIGRGDKPFCPRRYHRYCCDDRLCNEPKYRLVCVSDLGLSVRKSGEGLGVWVTSLTTGRPVPGATVRVFSSANIEVMNGTSGSDGWCVPTRVQKGEPFAVVVTTPSGDDRTFMALTWRMTVDETYTDGARADYVAKEACTGFAWTERGIYRHDEKIFYHLLLRTGEVKAPKPFPVTLQLVTPKGDVFTRKTLVSDELGAIAYDGFAVPADQPSGKWRIRAVLPGEKEVVFAEREIKIEEFAPPQVRVTVAAEEDVNPSNFAFTVSAEHLFGGAASALRCEGAVVFEDVPFAPAAWKGYQFGNEDLGLKPSFRRLGAKVLDAEGRMAFDAPLWKDSGLPKAMVRATAQGTAFEDGGRPATARATVLQHYYPYYIGSTLSSWVRKPEQGMPRLALACVNPDGTRVAEAKQLTVRLERIDSVYSYKQGRNGVNTWNSERIRVPASDDWTVITRTDADTETVLPVVESGDYVVTVFDGATGVSYARAFYLSDWGDEAVRAPLSNPTEVTLRADKAAYRVGETPRLIVKSPFAGFAMLSVQRERERYTQILELTNATSEMVLRPVCREDAPNLDVYLSVVQSVTENARHLAARAHGQTTVKVMPQEYEIPVKVDATVEAAKTVRVKVQAPGAAEVWVTVVDEGINLLTGEPTPDPVAAFAEERGGCHPLYDIYGKILPVDGAALKANGIKTGGGFGAEMLGRVSPVGTRRFKPLALQRQAGRCRCPNGGWLAEFKLPPFVGEVRVTAVAHSTTATGAASVQAKVAPEIVMMPDAPRFAAPNDSFEVALPIHNRSGAAATLNYEILADGAIVASDKTLHLAKDAATNIFARVRAPSEPGEMRLVYRVGGCGEPQEQAIDLPVRPAVAWREVAGVALKGESPKCETSAFVKYVEREFDSPLGEYEAALRWLAEYRHGCLEQTCSRVFPLVAAGGILNGIVSNATDAVARGVRRVESMVRENDFTMWPDCNCAPWNREVSLYAAHFLFAAEKAGITLNPLARKQVVKFLTQKWQYSTLGDESTYAAYVLALSGAANRDRLFSLYDKSAALSALARARLALAFVEINDLTRARTLLAESYEPQSVKEAAFQLLARVAVNPKDERNAPLLVWLNESRDRERFSWGTTEENAHALLAIGAYFQSNPPKKGEKFIAWRKLTLPKVENVKAESSGIFLARRFLTADGKPADLANLTCGDLLYSELSITSAVSRVVNDLVIEDLFSGGFEPVHNALERKATVGDADGLSPVADWVMRTDARDDRMLVFSKKFTLGTGDVARVSYPVRVVSAGEFVLPGASVEGMYNPGLRSCLAPGHIVVHH